MEYIRVHPASYDIEYEYGQLENNSWGPGYKEIELEGSQR
jgi:hypothetical protein